ncbi:MAG TPA: acyloxyacyl hydrolase [Kiloniellales bacterium]|nr:acyloxyacyl hydrolase [Kiloniellales bacterium]
MRRCARWGIALVSLLVLLLGRTASAATEGASDGTGEERSGVISELRAGLSAHDVALFSGDKESGVDFDLEVLFVSPRFLGTVFSPRPLIGGSLNSAGDTSQLYGGIAWTWRFAPPLFIELGLNLALHDGELEERPDAKGLGCHLLFRESLSLGFHFGARHSLMATVAHISNAGLCDPNEGLDTVGLRYGFRF